MTAGNAQPETTFLTWDNFVPDATKPETGTVKQGNGNLVGGSGFFLFGRGVFDYLKDDSTVLERDPLDRIAAEVPRDTPTEAAPRIVAMGVRPSSAAFLTEATTTQAAPSLMPEALPAVTEPSFLKAGRSRASFSTVVP